MSITTGSLTGTNIAYNGLIGTITFPAQNIYRIELHIIQVDSVIDPVTNSNNPDTGGVVGIIIYDSNGTAINALYNNSNLYFTNNYQTGTIGINSSYNNTANITIYWDLFPLA